MLDKYAKNKGNYYCVYCGKPCGFDQEYAQNTYYKRGVKKTVIHYFHTKCYYKELEEQKLKWKEALNEH